MTTKEYTDDQVAVHNGSYRSLVNALNADSKLTAAQTELTNNNTPLNMNSQLITGLADAQSGSDLLNR